MEVTIGIQQEFKRGRTMNARGTACVVFEWKIFRPSPLIPTVLPLKAANQVNLACDSVQRLHRPPARRF